MDIRVLESPRRHEKRGHALVATDTSHWVNVLEWDSEALSLCTMKHYNNATLLITAISMIFIPVLPSFPSFFKVIEAMKVSVKTLNWDINSSSFTVLSIELRRNRLDLILKQNLSKGLSHALQRALNDSTASAQVSLTSPGSGQGRWLIKHSSLARNHRSTTSKQVDG